eukprot:3841631-Amphidinium_carterae.1
MCARCVLIACAQNLFGSKSGGYGNSLSGAKAGVRILPIELYKKGEAFAFPDETYYQQLRCSVARAASSRYLLHWLLQHLLVLLRMLLRLREFFPRSSRTLDLFDTFALLCGSGLMCGGCDGESELAGDSEEIDTNSQSKNAQNTTKCQPATCHPPDQKSSWATSLWLNLRVGWLLVTSGDRSVAAGLASCWTRRVSKS